MNRQLEKIIKENRSSFDNQLPSDGHLLRFEQRLILQRRRRNTKYCIRFVAAIAASILLLLGILPPESGSDQAQASDIPGVTAYYQFKISEQIDSINVLVEKNEEAKILLQKAIKSMQQEVNALQEIGKNIPEENYISALVRCYDKQIETLTSIQSLLENK